MTTNCYHTRDGNGQKLTGGMLHATTHDEAAHKATAGLEVKVNRGNAYFVDKEGRKVSLYLSVHPEHTPKGQAAIAKYRKEKEELAAKERENGCRFEEENEESFAP